MRALLQVAAVLAVNFAASFALRSDAGHALVGELGDAATLVANVALGVAMIALALAFTRRREDWGLAWIGAKRTAQWMLIAGLGSKLVAYPVLELLRLLYAHAEDPAVRRAVAHVANGPLLLVIVLPLWAGFWEELVFRGFILGRARAACGDVAGIAIQAVAFGAVHIWQSPEGQVHAVIVGLVFGWVAIRTRSVIPGMVAHAALDMLAILAARYASNS